MGQNKQTARDSHWLHGKGRQSLTPEHIAYFGGRRLDVTPQMCCNQFLECVEGGKKWTVLETSNLISSRYREKGDIVNNMTQYRLWSTNMKYENPKKNRIHRVQPAFERLRELCSSSLKLIPAFRMYQTIHFGSTSANKNLGDENKKGSKL